jgi:SAM-dependent methyltransferase
MYDRLTAVYAFLVPEWLLEPAGCYAQVRPWLEDLPAGAAVLDCACGLGQLAIGLAQAAFEVTATDASRAMSAHARRLAGDHDAAIEVATRSWAQLTRPAWSERYDAVLCVGNSLAHAAGAEDRRRALANMAGALRAGGRLVVDSRNWELERARGSRLEIAERPTVRDGRRALVVRSWQPARRWHARHRLEIAVVLLDSSVQPVTEMLEFWPFRHRELLADLSAVGLEVRESTHAADAERYTVVAQRGS